MTGRVVNNELYEKAQPTYRCMRCECDKELNRIVQIITT